MEKGFIELLIFDVLILIIPLLLYFFPPKEINAVYGYRTKRASKSKAAWDFAQKSFSRNWLLIPFIVIVSQLIMYFSGVQISGDPPIIPLVSLIEFLIGSIACICSTELALKNRIPNNN